MSDEDKQSTHNWEDTSDRTDAIQFILAVVNCPQNVRNLINILVGLAFSYSNPEFEATHKELSTRLKSEDNNITGENALQQIKRAHRRLKKWQAENNLTLVEYEQGAGSKDRTYLRKSHYYLHILSIADEVIKFAQKDRLWKKQKSKALEMAAIELRDNFAPNLVLYHRSKTMLSPGKEVQKNVKAAIKNLRNAMEILDRDGSVILIEDKVITEFEKTLDELKDHLLKNSMK